MRLKKNLLFVILTFILSNTVFANKPSQTIYESVLPPGARIVPGDPKQDEFYIVAANDEEAQIKTIDNQIAAKIKDKQTSASSVNATKQTNPVTISKTVSSASVNTHTQSAASHKIVSPIKTATTQILDDSFTKQRLAQIKLALKRVTLTSAKKTQRASNVTHSKVALRHHRIHDRIHIKTHLARVKKHIRYRTIRYTHFITYRKPLTQHKHRLANRQKIFTMRVALYREHKNHVKKWSKQLG